MKGQNSRISHRPDRRYSNLAQIQGGMVTDADLTEAGQLHQMRDEVLGAMALASGVPAAGGMVGLPGGLPVLQEGLVVAQGKVGRFALSDPAAATLSARLAAQADLPGGPALPAGPVLLYADLWERPVTAAEDPYLADPGLHGAETSFRTRTMVQVKAMPLTDIAQAGPMVTHLMNGGFPFMARGTARASVAAKAADLAIDPCDPCADRIEVSQTLPNALFRVEILSVARAQNNAVTGLTLAWSLENAEAVESLAALADPTVAAAFERAPAAYEFFNAATEAQAGAFVGHAALRPSLAGALAPVPVGNPAFTHVRRWDGAASVTLAGGVSNPLGAGTVTVAANRITLSAEFLTFTLDFTGNRQALAGDHWLVEIRRHAPEPRRLTLVGADASGANALPLGIEHRFCALFATTGEVPPAPDDATRRRLSMPPLSDLPAGHVAYAPACPDWYGPVTTVQAALDAICNLPAGKVTFTPPAADCARFQGVTTVQGALEKLCKVEDSSALSLVLRSMMDWGVVCGLRVSKSAAKPGVVTWTAGVALDPAGRIVEVKAGSADLNEARQQPGRSISSIQSKEGEVCLSMAFDADGTMTLHLTDAATARGPADPDFQAAVEACRKGKSWLAAPGLSLSKLTKAEKAVLAKVSGVTAQRKALKGSVGLSAQEDQIADNILERMIEDLAKIAGEEATAKVEAQIATATKAYSLTGLAGPAADKRRMEAASARLSIVAAAEFAFQLDCNCRHLTVPCPPKAADPALVPLACVVFSDLSPGGLEVDRICHTCCRKQALTWRSYRYYGGHDFAATILAEYESTCCPEPPPEDPGRFDDWLDRLDDLPREPLVPDWPIDPEILWPPKGGPSGPRPGGGYTDPINPDILGFGVKDATDILTGNGLDVTGVIDLADDPDGFVKALDLAAKGGTRATGPAALGDSVVMFARGGEALAFMPVGRGSGRYQFQTASEANSISQGIEKAVEKAVAAAVKAPAAGGPTLDLPDTAGLADLLADLTAQKDKVKDEIASLSGQRTALAQGLGALTAEVKALEQIRAQTAQGLAALKAEAAAVEKSRADIAAALDELKLAQADALRGVRAAQPVDSLKLGPEALTKLKGAGVVTVADLEAMPEARLKTLLTGTPLDAQKARDLVAGFLKPR